MGRVTCLFFQCAQCVEIGRACSRRTIIDVRCLVKFLLPHKIQRATQMRGSLNFTGGKGLPSGKTPDGVFLQTGLAVLALRLTKFARKLVQRCAFQVSYAHQVVGVDLPCINFLTEILPGPALAVFAFRGLWHAQTKTSLRASSPLRA